uniref:Uncharacterized protein n=1 Tax=Steinernema glaseri TaxID=37863 RepID=A0A1I8AAS9_9BILA
MYLTFFIIITVCTPLTCGQSLLFPHGYFNENKLSAKDAIYLNLLAQSALEYGGTTVEELNKLAEEKHKLPRIESPSLTVNRGLQKEIPVKTVDSPITPELTTTSGLSQESLPAVDVDEFGKVHELHSKQKPSSARYAPEKRNLKSFSEEEVDNPFAAIATRPPKYGRYGNPNHSTKNRGKAPLTAKKTFLTRDKLLGVHMNTVNSPRDRLSSRPPLPSTGLTTSTVTAPTPYSSLNADLDLPQIVFLPIPPHL